jgi:hypothetical protein
MTALAWGDIHNRVSRPPPPDRIRKAGTALDFLKLKNPGNAHPQCIFRCKKLSHNHGAASLMNKGNRDFRLMIGGCF